MSVMRPTYIHQLSRQVLSASAWLLLGGICIGYLSMIPAVDSWMDSASEPLGYLGRALLVLVGIAALLTWVSSIVHAATDSARLVAPRTFILGALLILSFAGAFFYYFLYVHWIAETGSPQVKQSTAGEPVVDGLLPREQD